MISQLNHNKSRLRQFPETLSTAQCPSKTKLKRRQSKSAERQDGHTDVSTTNSHISFRTEPPIHQQSGLSLLTDSGTASGFCARLTAQSLQRNATRQMASSVTRYLLKAVKLCQLSKTTTSVLFAGGYIVWAVIITRGMAPLCSDRQCDCADISRSGEEEPFLQILGLDQSLGLEGEGVTCCWF